MADTITYSLHITATNGHAMHMRLDISLAAWGEQQKGLNLAACILGHNVQIRKPHAADQSGCNMLDLHSWPDTD